MTNRIQDLPDEWREDAVDASEQELIGNGLYVANVCASELEVLLPQPTIITEDKATWPEDGQEIVYRMILRGTASDLFSHQQLHKDYGIDIDYWVGCIWWPIGTLFDVPDSAGEK